MQLVIYPGTFDPITNGHLDVIKRASRIFEKVIVAVTNNPSKTPLFSIAERKDMLSEETRGMENVSVDDFTGLLVHYVKSKKGIAVIRGLRATLDFEYEFQMALINRKLAPEVDTIFLMTHDRFIYLNSTSVKEAARYGGDISSFVSEYVALKLKEKYS